MLHRQLLFHLCFPEADSFRHKHKNFTNMVAEVPSGHKDSGSGTSATAVRALHPGASVADIVLLPGVGEQPPQASVAPPIRARHSVWKVPIERSQNGESNRLSATGEARPRCIHSIAHLSSARNCRQKCTMSSRAGR